MRNLSVKFAGRMRYLTTREGAEDGTECERNRREKIRHERNAQLPLSVASHTSCKARRRPFAKYYQVYAPNTIHIRKMSGISPPQSYLTDLVQNLSGSTSTGIGA